jgi:hypothetical protein
MRVRKTRERKVKKNRDNNKHCVFEKSRRLPKVTGRVINIIVVGHKLDHDVDNACARLDLLCVMS